MSDFLFSTERNPKGKLSGLIKDIYHKKVPDVSEFHGEWGSLAVSSNMYNGFEPYELESHICVVVGGPVLYFRDNSFLTDKNGNEGTKAVYNRWINDTIQWDEDLSGPFAILLINKEKEEAKIITDLLSFIPIFKSENSKDVVIGTHVDTVAKASNTYKNLDQISLGDFVLNGIITYPYTFYKNVKQIKPATIHIFRNIIKHDEYNYWQPDERITYSNINEAARDVRKALIDYIDRVTKNMTKAASFISGGEDSRSILAMLPDHLEKHAFIFLDEMNREGKIAKKVTQKYGAKFHAERRSGTYYLDILPEATDLLGSSFEYVHAHSYGFINSCNLDKYFAVFGGLLSDALLKGNQINKKSFKSLSLQWLYPKTNKENIPSIFKDNTVLKINKRRESYLKKIEKIRSNSASEWFNLWPITSDRDIANLHLNRRFFRSYEPFMANKIIKISATIPQDWKLKRKVFQKAIKPFLKKSKFIPHSNSGIYPYLPWYINFFFWFYFKTKRKLVPMSYQGPWTDWKLLMQSDEAQNLASELNLSFSSIKGIKSTNLQEIINNQELAIYQKRNLLQLSYFLGKEREEV